MSAASLFVAPTGSDTNDGAIGNPYLTPQKAISVMKSGDTVFLRGGDYALATQVKTGVAGTPNNPCRLWAYNGEKPVLDFTGFKDRGLYVSKDYWHVRGIEVKNAGSNGICLSTGGNSIIEGCIAHDNGLEGIKLTNGAHHCLILNCDAYRNYDAPNNGENADGFAAKSGIGPGNVFRGCRAWLNSDDGWDFYGCPQSIAIDSCWAFRNGLNIWNNPSWAGDGNAFKLGGAGDTASNIVTRSVAFDNVSKGFDQNHSTAGQTIYNCTGYRNGAANFSFYETPVHPGAPRHILKNNISYLGVTPSIDATATVESNSSQGFTVSDADFISLDTSLALAPRKDDYSLPDNGFLRLAVNSQFIDKGVNAGLPYSGNAPDLGAFETKNPAPIVVPAKKQLASSGLLCSIHEAKCTVLVEFFMMTPGPVSVIIYDLYGKKITPEERFIGTQGLNRIILNTKRIHEGIFIIALQNSGGFKYGKVMY